MAFFVFETLTGQRLHPMQYLLVGLSLVMFYLLLLALSEHIGFTPARIAASLVGALMNSVYLQAVLKGWRNSVLFTLALLALDGVMWGYCVRKIARCFWVPAFCYWRLAA